jgi:hypothetical protein
MGVELGGAPALDQQGSKASRQLSPQGQHDLQQLSRELDQVIHVASFSASSCYFSLLPACLHPLLDVCVRLSKAPLCKTSNDVTIPNVITVIQC